jgi:hypothetical protein
MQKLLTICMASALLNRHPNTIARWMQKPTEFVQTPSQQKTAEAFTIRVTSECAWMSLKKSRLEAGWILCKKNG